MAKGGKFFSERILADINNGWITEFWLNKGTRIDVYACEKEIHGSDAPTHLHYVMSDAEGFWCQKIDINYDFTLTEHFEWIIQKCKDALPEIEELKLARYKEDGGRVN